MNTGFLFARGGEAPGAAAASVRNSSMERLPERGTFLFACLLLAVPVGFFALRTVLRQPASARPGGLALALNLLRPGAAYETIPRQGLSHVLARYARAACSMLSAACLIGRGTLSRAIMVPA